MSPVSTKRIIIFAANGFIGKELCSYFHEENYHVTAVSRKLIGLPCSDFTFWNAIEEKADWLRALDQADVIINLCGKSVNCRYHAKNRQAILDSRVKTTELIGKALLNCSSKKRLWLNASTATIYQESFDHHNDERNGIIGSGFSVEIAKAWEKAFFQFKDSNCRQIALRSSIVIGKSCEFTKITRSLVKKGLGGRQGTGEQYISWIHIYDFCRAIELFIKDESLSGAINITAPETIKNKDFMKLCRKTLNVKIGLPAPTFLIHIGAFFMRTEAELPLKSRKIKANTLEKKNFQFKYPKIEECLKDVLGEN